MLKSYYMKYTSQWGINITRFKICNMEASLLNLEMRTFRCLTINLNPFPCAKNVKSRKSDGKCIIGRLPDVLARKPRTEIKNVLNITLKI